jgi:hypothetical protein
MKDSHQMIIRIRVRIRKKLKKRRKPLWSSREAPLKIIPRV